MADYLDERETAPLAPAEAVTRPGLPPGRPPRPRGVVGASGGGSKSAGSSSAAPDWEKYGLKGDTMSSSSDAVGQQGEDEEAATFDRRQDAAGSGGIGTIGENNEIFSEHQV
jgi:hypothetical protein